MSADRAATILARFNSAHNDLMWKLRDCAFDTAEQFPGDRGVECGADRLSRGDGERPHGRRADG